MNRLESIIDVIRKRRSIFPVQYSKDPIPVSFISTMLEMANWAPTHRRTEPWRFVVVSGKAKTRLGDFLSTKYKVHTSQEKFNERKYRKIQDKFEQSQYVILICLQRDLQERVPEWEEIASVAMAVQNMWLTCSAAGIGCYWSTPAMIQYMDDFVPLEKGERCLGLFYVGGYDGEELSGIRGSIEEKVRFISE